MNVTDLPLVNALLNLISATLLTIGFINIKKGNQETHRRFMKAALSTTSLFLISYVTYHYQVGSVPYQHYDWTRPVYFAVLIPHIILAASMAPFIIILVRAALKENFERHKKLAKIIWPIWMYVSVTGIIVYLMLYQL